MHVQARTTSIVSPSRSLQGSPIRWPGSGSSTLNRAPILRLPQVVACVIFILTSFVLAALSLRPHEVSPNVTSATFGISPFALDQFVAYLARCEGSIASHTSSRKSVQIMSKRGYAHKTTLYVSVTDYILEHVSTRLPIACNQQACHQGLSSQCKLLQSKPCDLYRGLFSMAPVLVGWVVYL